jgi:hypothetical protein
MEPDNEESFQKWLNALNAHVAYASRSSLGDGTLT